MKIHHTRIISCPSTQKVLIDHFLSQKFYLVSCQHQEKGMGRHKKIWSQEGKDLAFSFSYPSNTLSTLFPLQVTFFIKNEIQKLFGIPLYLKWPNDLVDQAGNKIAGILTHHIQNTYLCGVGINCISRGNSQEYGKSLSHFGLTNNQIKQQFGADWQHDLPEHIYKQLLTINNFPSYEQINTSLLYKDTQVKIFDQHNTSIGLFLGIGPDGEGLLKVNNEIKKCYNGSLRPL